MGSDQIQNLSDVLIRDNIVQDVSFQGSEIKIFVQNAQFLLPRIVESAVHAGIRIDHITITHPDMNDVFIHYTGKDLGGGEVREQTGRVAMMKRRRAR